MHGQNEWDRLRKVGHREEWNPHFQSTQIEQLDDDDFFETLIYLDEVPSILKEFQ